MFKRVLIANRGEIAVRVMRACRDLGIETVAVYSDLDIDAVHTRYADQAFNVGPAPAAQSYLVVENILDAAKRSGAEAVHPGYGFLAENAAFAQAVIDAGLTWVGPAPAVIDGMGDKMAGRKAAQEANVPTIPGTKDPVTEAEEVRIFGKEHGFPVAIKASAGGGGKGFRVVADESEIEDALAGAAREAENYFSNPEVYIERYLERPRHIEIQVLGDANGNVISFPERDCSLQRRHQKLVEESPSPALKPDVRAKIMDAAKRLAANIGYQNAGTCEFLLDSDHESFYFLEMNTRLQVEHPVTELVSGIDLVVAQLRVAAGEDIGFTQDDIKLNGHAIECRINAENAAKNFMPAPGHIGSYHEPAGPGVRVDSGVEPDYTVPQAYDPMIAKLVTYGADREQAHRRMLRALAEYEVEGISTTIPFHRLMLADEHFVSGDYHTGTVERELDLGLLKETPKPKPKPGEPMVAERDFTVEVSGKRFRVKAREQLDARVQRKKPRLPKKLGSAVGGSGENLIAPMQGTIVKVTVKKGDRVKIGDTICVLEAMKMENSILSHTDGTVEELKVEAGHSVETGAILAIIR